MADKKKMSVVEILAAARKKDGGGASEEPSTPAAPSETPTPSGESQAPQEKVAPPGSEKRPSVADILAAARTGKSAEQKPAEKPAPKKAAAKPTAKPAATESAAAKPSEPRDTASILAAARKSSKAGPMSKAEAAAKAKADPVPKEKPKVVVPPMPEKPAYAKGPSATAGTKAKESDEDSRRNFLILGFAMVGAVTAVWTGAVVKFMFPNVLREPPSQFKVGFPDAFPPGQVQTRFIPQYGVWVVNTEYDGEQQIVALKAVCTHLGCTPNWLEAEQKFKCPCHGSGFYKDGINFEGPAPRPLERYAIRIADDGQIEIDKSRIFQEEMGQWDDPSSFIPV